MPLTGWHERRRWDPANMKRSVRHPCVAAKSGLLDLPDDTLVAIFRRLSPVPSLVALSAVCRRLRRVARTSSLWRRVVVPESRSYRAVHVLDDSDPGGSVFDRPPRSTKRQRTGSSADVSAAASAIAAVTKIAGNQLVELDVSTMRPNSPAPRHQLSGSAMARLSSAAGSSLQAFACPPTSRLLSSDFVTFADACPKLLSLTVHDVDCFSISTLADVVKSHTLLTRIVC
jgi:hypothetical protein